jgi:hypothetical protein
VTFSCDHDNGSQPDSRSRFQLPTKSALSELWSCELAISQRHTNPIHKRLATPRCSLIKDSRCLHRHVLANKIVWF